MLEVVEEEIELLMDHQVQMLPQEVEEDLEVKDHIQVVQQELLEQLTLAVVAVVVFIILVVLAVQEW